MAPSKASGTVIGSDDSPRNVDQVGRQISIVATTTKARQQQVIDDAAIMVAR
jgi:hypothetical protein